MLSSGKIAKIDKSNMLDRLVHFPEMYEETLSRKIDLPHTEFKNVVVTAMGGSAISGDLLGDWLDMPVPFLVSKNDRLPAWVDEKSFVLAISYSGNTKETLACFSDAIEKNAHVAAITSGGKLEEMCKTLKKPCLKVPPGLPPRVALPYIFPTAALVFKKLGLATGKDEEIKESVKVLKKMRDELAPTKKDNQAERIANTINETVPVIYAPMSLNGVASRFKKQLNENSKIIAKAELFPELSHNEIVGLVSAPKNLSFLFFRDIGESEHVKNQIEFTKNLLRERKPIEMQGRGKGRLAYVLSLVYLGDFITFYLAMLRGVDPTPIDVINQLKTKH